MNSRLYEIDGFTLANDNEAKTMILNSNKIEKSLLFMKAEKIVSLELNDLLGCKASDIAFLNDFDFVKRINILNDYIDDLSPIHHLKNLETLIIQSNCKTKIDFTAFPKLKDLRTGWRKNSPTLYEATQLEALSLSSFSPKEKDLSLLKKLVNLRKLNISSSAIYSLAGIENLQKLEKLELYYLRNLENLENIKLLPDLKELCIESCKKADLKPIADLQQIEKLKLVKTTDIESVSLFSKLKNLQTLILGETKIIDGNLSPMFELPRLKTFKGRHYKHYSHVFSEFV